jgi:hypothetical protein
MCEKPDCKYLC